MMLDPLVYLSLCKNYLLSKNIHILVRVFISWLEWTVFDKLLVLKTEISFPFETKIQLYFVCLHVRDTEKNEKINID